MTGHNLVFTHPKLAFENHTNLLQFQLAGAQWWIPLLKVWFGIAPPATALLQQQLGHELCSEML